MVIKILISFIVDTLMLRNLISTLLDGLFPVVIAKIKTIEKFQFTEINYNIVLNIK